MALNTRDGLATARKIWGVYDKAATSVVALTSASHEADMFLAAAAGTAAGAAPSNTTIGAIPNSATTGAMNYSDSLGTSNRLVRAAGYGEYCVLYNRVWHAGPITLTSGSYSASGWTGTTVVDRPATAAGLEAWVCVSPNFGAVAATWTITYTNSQGTSGRTATAPHGTSTTAPRACRFALQAGDAGVQSIQDISCSATTTGSAVIVLARPLTVLPTHSAAQNGNRFDVTRCAVDIPTNACLYVMVSTIATVSVTPKISIEVAAE